MSTHIEPERLILRKFTPNDAKAVCYNSKQPIVAHYMSDMVLETELDALNWINWINNDKLDISVPNIVLAVVLKSTNQCIGLIGIAPKYELENQVEILFSIADEYQNQGYVSEAGHAMIHWAFENTPLERLVAIVKPDNIPSNRVIEKLRFTHSGERNIDYDGKMTDFHFYRLEKPHSFEKMDEFFTARVDGYDEHMLNNVEGCKNGYIKMAKLLPHNINTLLDLGCGTGLELDEIFKLYPNIKVTGADLTKAMLDKLRQKHPNKKFELINASYFDCDFGVEKYDAVISFQTMHHFEHEQKIALYKKVCASLKHGGVYIECDYMVETQAEEDAYFAEIRKIRAELRIPPDEFYHYDTPCTIDNQIEMLEQAGFISAKVEFREENTTIVVARKELD